MILHIQIEFRCIMNNVSIYTQGIKLTWKECDMICSANSPSSKVHMHIYSDCQALMICRRLHVSKPGCFLFLFFILFLIFLIFFYFYINGVIQHVTIISYLSFLLSTRFVILFYFIIVFSFSLLYSTPLFVHLVSLFNLFHCW